MGWEKGIWIWDGLWVWNGFGIWLWDGHEGLEMCYTYICILPPPPGYSVVCGGGHTEAAPRAGPPVLGCETLGDVGASPAVGLSPTLGCDSVKVT